MLIKDNDNFSGLNLYKLFFHFRQILPVLEQIGTDPRCEVHRMVLGTREDKEGWLSILCPSSLACVDEGTAWASIVCITYKILYVNVEGFCSTLL